MTISHKNKNLNDNKIKILKISKKKIKMRNIGEETRFGIDDSYLLSNQDINRFLAYVGIEPQISYSIIRDFTS